MNFPVDARRPHKFLPISTGNITNAALEALFAPAIPTIATLVLTYDYVELTPTTLIVHR